jgi:hypothetical protein
MTQGASDIYRFSSSFRPIWLRGTTAVPELYTSGRNGRRIAARRVSAIRLVNPGLLDMNDPSCDFDVKPIWRARGDMTSRWNGWNIFEQQGPAGTGHFANIAI